MSNGDIQKSAPKKRGSWAQTGGDGGVAPVKKKATSNTSNSVSSVGSLWDKEDVRLSFVVIHIKLLLAGTSK